jgi:hypothetical protein
VRILCLRFSAKSKVFSAIYAENNKAILRRAKRREEEGRSGVKNPRITSDFFIHIASAEEFLAEHQAAIKKGIEALRLEREEVNAAHVQEWADNLCLCGYE